MFIFEIYIIEIDAILTMKRRLILWLPYWHYQFPIQSTSICSQPWRPQRDSEILKIQSKISWSNNYNHADEALVLLCVKWRWHLSSRIVNNFTKTTMNYWIYQTLVWIVKTMKKVLVSPFIIYKLAWLHQLIQPNPHHPIEYFDWNNDWKW